MAVVVDTGSNVRRVDRATGWTVPDGTNGALELTNDEGDIVGRFGFWVGVWDVD